VPELVADQNLVSLCGLYCGACGAFLKGKCEGCHETRKREWCKVRACCLDKKYATCADCGTFQNPDDCKKFNNIVSKIFGFFTKSDRAACIRQIRENGSQAFAVKMAGLKMHAIRRK
jgi:hypothetical protein